MNAIMMYMSGNSLQIFSIMMVFMLFKGPIQGLLSTNSVFSKLETPNIQGRLVGVKVVYVFMQLLLLALGIWKVNAMGLLPYISPFPLLDLILCFRCRCANSIFLGQYYTLRLVGMGRRA